MKSDATAMQTGPEQLRAWMGRAKVNQRQAADLLGIHEVFVSQLLSGQRNPGLENAVNIEVQTGIPVESWLLSRVSKDEPEPEAVPAKRRIAKR